MRVAIVSHRGLCRATARGRRSGENTIAAFRAGIEALASLGFPAAIEFDVRRSADGDLMVVHDATLRRVFGMRGRVSSSAAADLRTLGIPSLADVLARFPAAECHVEIKERGIARQVLQTLRSAGSIDHAVVSSFLWKEIAPLSSRVRIALTTAFPTRRTIRTAVAAGAWAIHPEHRKTTARLVAAAHDAGLRVNTWTVNTARSYARMERLGVDAVFSDNPHLLVER